MARRVVPTLLALLLAMAALSAFFQLGLRVRVLAAFRAEGAEVPALTAVALSPWLQPVAMGAAALMALAALALPIKRSRRYWTLGAAVTLLGTAFAFAVVCAVLPIFRPE